MRESDIDNEGVSRLLSQGSSLSFNLTVFSDVIALLARALFETEK